MELIYVHRWSALSPLELRAKFIETRLVTDEFSMIEVKDMRRLDRLAGYHKIAELVVSFEEADRIRELELGLEDKAKWAISFYGDVPKRGKVYELLKERVNDLSYKARLVPHRYEWMDGRDVSKLMMKGGTEFILAGDGETVYLGRTVKVFDYDSFKKRDMLRPHHDPKVNIPSRLARAMLNLLGAKLGEKLLDPFCGMGTILQEGVMLGLKPYGLDISKKMVKYARENSAWLSREEGVEDFGRMIRAGEARRLTHYFGEESMDLVATEPVLLPYIKGLPSKERAMKLLEEAKETYEAALEEIEKVLKPGGKAGVVVPGLKTMNGGFATLDVRSSGELEPLWEPVTVEGDVILRIIHTFRKPV